MRDDLKAALISAMKNKNDKAVATIRLINAAVKDKDIEARLKGNNDGISDGDILGVLQSMIKQRKDSIDAYQKGGRQDLIDKEQAEIDLIQTFLPKQMTLDEIKQAVQEAVRACAATSIKDMGKVMGLLKQKYQGQMDFGKTSAVIKEILG